MLVVSCAIAITAAACEERGATAERAPRKNGGDAGAADDDKTTFSANLPGEAPGALPGPAGLPGPKGTATFVPGIPTDIAIEPSNGQVFDARTEDREVKFSGFTDVASASVEVQVLSRPDAPITESSWFTISTTTSASTPTSFGDAAPIYRWSVTGVPSPKGTNRWASGGLLRYRTVMNVAGKRSALPFYDTASPKCVNDAGSKSWKDVLELCKSPFSPALGAGLGGSARAAALVSVTAASKNPPPYLSRRGDITAAETEAYYALVNAPPTLGEYKSRFGFGDEKDEIEATYFNAGDLGIGREMHCRSFNNATGTGIACYVRNYGVDKDLKPVFGGDQKSALDDAIARRNAFATVAMVKFGNKFNPAEGNDVQFFVYNAKETLANRAPLDNFGLNQAIPNNCLNCHGGKNEGGAKVVGSTFLPFDPEAFRYAPEGDRTYAAQEDNFRKLNALVASAGMPPPIVQFVDGLYSGKQDTAGTKANLDWMPKGWTETEESKTVYRELYRPYCRTCHISQVGDFAFMRFAEFTKYSRLAAESVCQTNEMPIAEVTTEAFINSGARAYFVNTLGLSTPCGAKQ